MGGGERKVCEKKVVEVRKPVLLWLLSVSDRSKRSNNEADVGCKGGTGRISVPTKAVNCPSIALVR